MPTVQIVNMPPTVQQLPVHVLPFLANAGDADALGALADRFGAIDTATRQLAAVATAIQQAYTPPPGGDLSNPLGTITATVGALFPTPGRLADDAARLREVATRIREIVARHADLQRAVQTWTSVAQNGGALPPTPDFSSLPNTAADEAWLTDEAAFWTHVNDVAHFLPSAAADLAQNWVLATSGGLNTSILDVQNAANVLYPTANRVTQDASLLSAIVAKVRATVNQNAALTQRLADLQAQATSSPVKVAPPTQPSSDTGTTAAPSAGKTVAVLLSVAALGAGVWWLASRAKASPAGHSAARRNPESGWRKITAPTQTFAQAKVSVFAYLRSQGWHVVEHLKVPHATSPDKQARVWFKPQAVYLATDRFGHFDFAHARSMWVDLRTTDGPKFLDAVKRWT
jgi:hypothetical protein